MAIQPQAFFPHYDAVEKSRTRLNATAFVPNRPGDSTTLNAATPIAIGAGTSFKTGVIMVSGFSVFTVVFTPGAGAANPCRLSYIVIDPVDATTELLTITVGDAPISSFLTAASWSNAQVGTVLAPAVHHLVKLQFTPTAGATTLAELRGLWMAAN